MSHELSKIVEGCGSIPQGEIVIAGWASGAQKVVPVCVDLPQDVHSTVVGGACGAPSPLVPTQRRGKQITTHGPAEPVISRLFVGDRHAPRHAVQVGERHR